MVNRQATQDDEYVTYAPPATTCENCSGGFEPAEAVRRSTGDQGASVYRHFECPKVKP